MLQSEVACFVHVAIWKLWGAHQRHAAALWVEWERMQIMELKKKKCNEKKTSRSGWFVCKFLVLLHSDKPYSSLILNETLYEMSEKKICSCRSMWYSVLICLSIF